MSQKKTNTPPSPSNESQGPSRALGETNVLQRDFGVFGQILKVDLSTQDDEFDYMIYAATVVQK